MFAAKTRPLEPRTPYMPAPASAAGGAGASPSLQRSISDPNPGVTQDEIETDMELRKLKSEAEPLASACKNAWAVLASPPKHSTARARKLAQIDRFYKQGYARASLDEPLFCKLTSK